MERSINQRPFWGTYFHHYGNVRKGCASATYPLEIRKTGRYALFITTTQPGGRSSNTPLLVECRSGKTVVTVNQDALDNPYGLVKVGEYALEAGETVSIRISNEGTDNYTIFDVVRIVLLL